MAWVSFRDYAEAAKWYRKAADQGRAKAQLSLGMMYFVGKGVSLKTMVKRRNGFGWPLK